FYFRGPTIDGAANCQSLANDQDIVVDGFTRNLISNRPITLEELSPEAYLVRGKISGEAATVHPLELPPLQKEIAKSFLPKGIERINQVGEFRTVITVFIAFSNIDTHEEMASFAKIILEKADNFGGYFKEIDFGDKGGLIPIFFGAPISYENSVVRAIEFALSIREEVDILCKDHPDIQYRMGITMGTAFTGYVGGQERCQYACVGTRTNLAARIMMHADWQEILVDDEIAHTSLFRFKPKGKTKYKGISEPIPTFVLLGRQHQAGKPGYTGPMIAREAECRTLREFAMPIFRNETAGLAYVYGEAGIGKSRTLHELRRQLSAQYRLSWQLCPSDQILRKPFNSFIYFLKQYFHQSIDLDVEQKHKRFQEELERLAAQLAKSKHRSARKASRELKRTRPILAALLGLRESGSLWEKLDAKGRYQNTIAAIVNLFLVESLVAPLIIELEDIHWIDEDSQMLIQELLLRMKGFPILLLGTSRYYDDGSCPTLVAESELASLGHPLLRIDLGALSPADVRTFAERALAGPIHDEFLEVLLRATNSNPFYVEQLLEYFRENSLLLRDDGRWNLRDKSIRLSNSINSILTARIDRLSNMVRETVKAAAVIGREFDVPVLTEVLRNDASFRDAGQSAQLLLKEQIAEAEKGQIWSAMNELRYIFRHSLMREAAYS
ncbi:MAG: AAA family ATPase, partial [Bacteroidota bacterium]